jgi:hypothetical protein
MRIGHTVSRDELRQDSSSAYVEDAQWRLDLRAGTRPDPQILS